MTIIRHEKHIGLAVKPCWCYVKSKYNQGNDCPAHKRGRFAH